MTYTRAVLPRRFTPPRAVARPLRTFLGLCAALLFTCAHTRAQQSPSLPADDEVLTVRTDFVAIPVVVTAARGQRVSDLTQTDFAMRIDARTVPVAYFAAGTTRVALLFALDASGSIAANIARQRETALALYARFGVNSSVAVLTFTERPRLVLPFTAELAQARAAFQIDAQPNQHTAIFDAALAAVRAFDVAQTRATERRIVVLISDGLDTASTINPATVIAEAQARGVTLYVIHLPLYTPSGDELVVRRPARGFRELGARTGGKYFLVGDARTALDPRATIDLAPIFQAIAADLQSQYVLGFYPPADTRIGYHRVEVSLSAATGRKLRIRQLRDGYNLKP